MTVLTLLANTYLNIFTYISQLVLKFGRQLLARGIAVGRNFVNAIVNWIKQLPSRVYSLLLQVVRRIITAGQQWVTNAKQKAGEIVTGVYNALSNLPSKISSALSGVVNAITKPFTEAYNSVAKTVENIKKKAEETLHINVAKGGELGEFDIENQNLGVTASQYLGIPSDAPILIEDNINLTLDLQNVPTNISTNQLIEGLQNKNVLNALVTNRDFQTLDATVKQKINLKAKRSRG
jgi:hypothetical protein